MKAFLLLFNVFLAAALLVALGCPWKAPGTPATRKPPEAPPEEDTYLIRVMADPPEVTVGGGTPSTITVDVRLRKGGRPPKDLTAVALSTDLGGFGSVNGPADITLQLIGGRSQAALFAGPEAGTATVGATAGSSSGGANVWISSPETSSEPGVEPKLSADTSRDPGTGEKAGTRIEADSHVHEARRRSANLTNGSTFAAMGGGQPHIVSLSPASGSNDGGTRMSIVGRGFAQPLQVLFGLGATANSFRGAEAIVQSVTPNHVVVVTPPARGYGSSWVNQRVNVLVRNLDSGATSILDSEFQYGFPLRATAMGPDSGPYTGGTRVALSGPGFDGPLAVSLGGIGQPINRIRGSEVVFTTAGIPVTSCPASGFVTATGLRVVNTDTGASDDADLSFNYLVPLPRVFGVSPAGGRVGTTLTLTGVNFAPNVQVQFGDPTAGASAQVVYVNPTKIVVRVPAPAADFDQRPCGIQGRMNTPTPISVTVRNLDEPGCSVTYTNGFRLDPSDAAAALPRRHEPSLLHRLFHRPATTGAPARCQPL